VAPFSGCKNINHQTVLSAVAEGARPSQTSDSLVSQGMKGDVSNAEFSAQPSIMAQLSDKATGFP
jgi:ribosomal protein S16